MKKALIISAIAMFWTIFLVTFVIKCCGILMLTDAGPWIEMGALLVAGILTLMFSEAFLPE